MKLAAVTLSLFIPLATAVIPAHAAGQAAGDKETQGSARTIELTGSENFKFDKTRLTARPGEKLHIVLKAVGTMPKTVMAHNFVLPKPGANPVEINNAAFNARATDFIPESMKDKILAYTPLAGAGETVDVTFTAPTKAGSYTYMCTFPGHFAMGMKGTLVVK